MVQIYCRSAHKNRSRLCDECRELLDYAGRCLDRCPFQACKTTCANCKVHCYKPSMREKIKGVMRYAGPRMMYRHPVLAVLHVFDGLRKDPLSPTVKKT